MASLSPTRGDDQALRSLLCVLLLAAVAFVVIYPILSLTVTSFQINQFGLPSEYGLRNWQQIMEQARIGDAIFNTFTLSLARQFFSLIFGVLIAWLIARTNLPGSKWIEVGFWIALFMPILPVTLSWVLLMGGRNALVNKLLYELPFIDGPVFNVYTWWGIVWVHLMTSTIAIKVFLLVPAFRSLDSSLEEAARTSGASPLGTVWRVVVPIMAPTIVVVMLLGMIRSMQAFEVELILGTPARVDVYSTIIFRAMTEQPPLYGLASSLSIVFLLTIVPFVVLQQWYGYRHSHASVSGKYSNRIQDLGAWRWPLFSILAFMLMLMTIVPVIFLLMSTFMKLFGMFNMANPWTTNHWTTALGRGDIVRSLWNTINLGLSSGIAGMVAFTIIAYVTVKTRFAGSRLLDFMTWLPALIPGLVLSLGLLQMFAGAAVFRPFYGTIIVMILAIVISTMTVGTQIIRGNLRQLSRELEEAAWVFGGSRLYTIRRIVLPLIAPSVAVIGLEVFATAVSAVGVVALLGTGATQPLSLLQLSLLDSGKFEPAAVVGIVIMVLTISAALLARYIGTRFGLQDQVER